MKSSRTALLALFVLVTLAPRLQSDAAAAPPPDPIIHNCSPNATFSAWIIDGQSNPSLTLAPGSRHIFHVIAPGHPFYIKTLREVGDGNQFTDGVRNNGDDNGDVQFDVPDDAPPLLFYQCGVHPSMGGRLNIMNTVGVEDGIPHVAWLGRSVPNPTSGAASFRIGLPRDAELDIVMFDARGRRVRTLWNGPMAAGTHSIAWDGRSQSGSLASSGSYFYRMRVEGRTLTGRLQVMR